MANKARAEFGGILLIACGVPQGSLSTVLGRLEQTAPATPITVLAYPAQAEELADAGISTGDIWWLSRSGPQGFLALIRRISWHRFDIVYHPRSEGLGWLKYFIWPQPLWHRGKSFS